MCSINSGFLKDVPQADSSSREALVKLVRTGKNYGIRKQALFWLTRDEPDETVIDLLEELLRN